MSKNMKAGVFDSSPYGVISDAKTRFKHQVLSEEYQELERDVEVTSNRLKDVKQRKLTLSAEVGFLRQRYKYLMKNKSPNPLQERDDIQQHNVGKQRKQSMKVKISNKMESTQRKLPPVYKLNQKGKVHLEKEASLRNAIPTFLLNHEDKLHRGKDKAIGKPSAISNLNPRSRAYKGKEVALGSTMSVMDLNQQERIYSGNGTVMRNQNPVFDLSQKETSFGVRQASLQSQALVFDLNQISREEEESQVDKESLRFEDPMQGSIGGNDEQQNSDMMLSACRNVGDGSSRGAKRKISWQDPVALRV